MATKTPKAPMAILIGNELPAKPDRNGIVAAATISAKRSRLNKHLAKFFRLPDAILECFSHVIGQIDPREFRDQLKKRAVVRRGAADRVAQTFASWDLSFCAATLVSFPFLNW